LDRLSKLNPNQQAFFEQLKEVYGQLDSSFQEELNRSVSFGDVFVDRWDRASKLGFGERTNIYDSSLVIGDVNIGSDCWIGPYTILDGSGYLKIGNYCTISAGVQIYSHNNIKRTLLSGQHEIEKSSVSIGNNTYLGPNTVISMGVEIGNHCVVGVGSFVNRSFPDFSIIAGVPAKQIGNVILSEKNVELKFFNQK
jgi:acetyltransferase-like isoleucine patch superfamily enzyme